MSHAHCSAAARLSGINVDLVLVVIYGISGLLAAIGGILVMGRLQLGAYQNGTNMTLISVASVVIGGTALSGGIGGIWGTLGGCFYHPGGGCRTGLSGCAFQRQRNCHRCDYCAGGSPGCNPAGSGQVAAFARDVFRLELNLCRLPVISER
jgi:hypothetical protein